MFSWLKELFVRPASEAGERESEMQVVKNMRAATVEITKAAETDPEMLKKVEMLKKDFEERSLKEVKRGTSSSPISSP